MGTRSWILGAAAAVLVLTGVAQAAPAPLAPCRSDLRRFCPDTKPGSGEEWSCLQGQRFHVGKACRNALDRLVAASGSGTPSNMFATGAAPADEVPPPSAGIVEPAPVGHPVRMADRPWPDQRGFDPRLDIENY